MMQNLLSRKILFRVVFHQFFHWLPEHSKSHLFNISEDNLRTYILLENLQTPFKTNTCWNSPTLESSHKICSNNLTKIIKVNSDKLLKKK